MSSREEIAQSIHSRHMLVTPEGEEMELDLEDPAKAAEQLDKLGDAQLKAYVLSEEVKGQPGQAPPSINAMRQLELIDYEPSSDSGHFRFYPKGNLVFELLKDWADKIALERLGCMQIETPLLYDCDDEEIQEQAGSFHERHYKVSVPGSKKEFLLRFAGDFGLFKIMQQAQYSYRMLPLRVYEFSKSFRYEKKGELAGLKRLRAFHMPDVHCFCKDLEQGWQEYQDLYRQYADLADASGVQYAIGFRVVKEFYDEHKDKIIELLRYSGKPAFIEVLSGMKHYWAVKHEFQAIDSVGGNLQLSTVQLDVKDAQVYGIEYADSDGSKQGCIICHSSIGSIERWIYAVLEEALKSDPAMLPVWLAPTQLRLVPVAERHQEYCRNLAFDNVRVDIDDSEESVNKKVAKAGSEWVPYVAVVGDAEMEDGSLMVNLRNGGKERYTPEQLAQEIRSHCEGMPHRPLPLPKLLSRRPIFF